MPEWTEHDSATYRDIAAVAVPRHAEMMATLVAAFPCAADAAVRIVELGSGEGRLAETLLETFPNGRVLALDGSESMRAQAAARVARFGERVRIRAFDVATLDWWDLLHGADVVVSSLCLHHLTDAKKRYLYKAVADRLAPGGAFLVADLVEPTHPAGRRLAADAWDGAARQEAEALGAPDRFARFVAAQWNHYRFPDAADRPAALLHHLIWLTHAGFAAVDCFWMFAGHAVFGGYKQRTD